MGKRKGGIRHWMGIKGHGNRWGQGSRGGTGQGAREGWRCAQVVGVDKLGEHGEHVGRPSSTERLERAEAVAKGVVGVERDGAVRPWVGAPSKGEPRKRIQQRLKAGRRRQVGGFHGRSHELAHDISDRNADRDG